MYPYQGKCRPEACVQGDCYRFTMLTPHILRLEYDPEGIFEDRPSQTVFYRNHPVPYYKVKDTGKRLEIDTEQYHLIYHYGSDKRFTENSLIIEAKNGFTNYGASWRFGTTEYGDPPRHHNLYGTTRTLDRAEGAVPLERGLMDSSGHSFFDDSNTVLIGENGEFCPRHPGTLDVYYICCQRDYAQTLAEFYSITGRPPMLPRYALGNWWSRWYNYSAESYKELMDRFAGENIPFSMAVLDMDWHITEVDPKYGKGWTGFTWNKKLFPDPKRFAEELQNRGLHTILNLHPADGVRAFEDAYETMAEATGIDPKSGDPVHFDLTDPIFSKAYFEKLLRPLEADGVNHWWIDWQQGRKSFIPGLDPLWLLNHYHYTDNCRDGKRGLILSRYCGLGAHRYPAGFSGDTVVSWDSLRFQAYFTATATNAGFCFWSHDIGGFTSGVRDSELFVRWLQLGVFSPFVRLHSTRNTFASKEPWNFVKAVQPSIVHWLRLRHRLLPYIYTETYRQHTQAEALVRPVYYDYPVEKSSYDYKQQYMFGSELMVCPITAPADEKTGMGFAKAWIPKGMWTDIFTGKIYEGDRICVLNRSVENYPVLAKAGAIIPMAILPEKNNDVSNPERMEVLVFPGESGSYTMYEDDGISIDTSGKEFITEFHFDSLERKFTIRASGNDSCVPQSRIWCITFRGFKPFNTDGDLVDHVAWEGETNSVKVFLKPVHPGTFVELTLPDIERVDNSDYEKEILTFLTYAKISIDEKQSIFRMIEKTKKPLHVIQALIAEGTDPRVIAVLTEFMV